MIILSVAHGLCGGAHASPAATSMAATAGIKRFGSVTGMMYAFMRIGATLESPISGAIFGLYWASHRVIVW
ncbi:hypothetical protein KI688_007080 [Linnemannia hyalina]|uniref:Major facilitator superfamily (MFS) profile domain-containing protein n=1 Tax=Linnemannia hyalina TaxID=64524 RepID=A0A9P7XIG8_9FUNG|nr:hypothetical protein KI688_007080 [Linnemannia hyalina]